MDDPAAAQAAAVLFDANAPSASRLRALHAIIDMRVAHVGAEEAQEAQSEE